VKGGSGGGEKNGERKENRGREVGRRGKGSEGVLRLLATLSTSS